MFTFLTFGCTIFFIIKKCLRAKRVELNIQKNQIRPENSSELFIKTWRNELQISGGRLQIKLTIKFIKFTINKKMNERKFCQNY